MNCGFMREYQSRQYKDPNAELCLGNKATGIPVRLQWRKEIEWWKVRSVM